MTEDKSNNVSGNIVINTNLVENRNSSTITRTKANKNISHEARAGEIKQQCKLIKEYLINVNQIRYVDKNIRLSDDEYENFYLPTNAVIMEMNNSAQNICLTEEVYNQIEGKDKFLPNALLMPHVGYVTAENYSVFYTQMIEGLEACVNGKPIRIIEK